MRKMYSRVAAGLASFIIGISTISTTAYAAFAPLPGSTRTERYSLAEYATENDLAVLKEAVSSMEDPSTMYECDFLGGTQITDASEIAGGWRLLAVGNAGDLNQDQYDYVRYTNCYLRVDSVEDATMVFNYGVYFDPKDVNPITGESAGSNLDMTGHDPEVLNGNITLVEADPFLDNSYPVLNVQLGNKKMSMVLYQFTKASGGRTYAFGRITWNDGNTDTVLLGR